MIRPCDFCLRSFPKDKASGEVHPQRVTDILTRPIYAGYVEAPRWNVSRRKGHHEALISLETFERIRQCLTEAAKAPYRKDLNADFVLRGAVACAECGGALTACWSKSSTGKLYPYMLCHTAGCPSRRKSIPLGRIEGEFEALLRSLELAPRLSALVRAMFKNAWDQRAVQAASVAEAPCQSRHSRRRVSAIEEKVGLVGQPRAIVFHEKEGRRHAHCVWSRIDAERMRAINLPHFKVKLRDVSRLLYIEHGWRMPSGLIDSAERDPLNVSRAEWQQARRTEQDPRALKARFQECWAASDSAAGFLHALDARGLALARGDHRGIVAVDFRGEVYAVARWVGIPTKAVRARFGNGETLKSVAEVRAQMAARLSETLTGFADEATREFKEATARLEAKRRAMVVSQRSERRELAAAQARRGIEEARSRSLRFRTGLLGIWDRVIGRHAKLRREREAVLEAAARRDAHERQALIDQQLANRRQLRAGLHDIRDAHLREMIDLQHERDSVTAMKQTDLPIKAEPQPDGPR